MLNVLIGIQILFSVLFVGGFLSFFLSILVAKNHNSFLFQGLSIGILSAFVSLLVLVIIGAFFGRNAVPLWYLDFICYGYGVSGLVVILVTIPVILIKG